MALRKRPDGITRSYTRRTRPWLRLGLAALVVIVALAVRALQNASDAPDTPVASTAPSTPSRAQPTTPAETTPAPTTSDGGDGSGSRSEAATVPDVPLAWKRIAAQAAAWPAATQAPESGKSIDLPTVPASRVRDTIGLNLDIWRQDNGYADFSKVLAKVAELDLRHARVNMQPGPKYGLERMQQLGGIGVRLDVLMGDALGRYGTGPYADLDQRLKSGVLPFVDAVEGTNEPDLAKEPNWIAPTRGHQAQVVLSVKDRRGDPIGVIAPSVGREKDLAELGDYSRLADAGNAHAYANGSEPSAALDEWLGDMDVQIGDGPVIVTEAGFQDDVGQTKYHLPTPAQVQADYVPRTILEAMRRGIPQVYLYEMIDRWDDPFHVDTSAHFGLLGSSLQEKPSWKALVRLQRALLDGGRPDATATPLRATVTAGPKDLRLLAFRRRDGSAALAVWRAVSEWDPYTTSLTPVTDETVSIDIDGSLDGALTTNLATGDHERLAAGHTLELKLGGAPVVVTKIQSAG